MRRLLTVTVVAAMLGVTGAACAAEEPLDTGSPAPPVRASLWILPPAYEFPVSGSGHLSLEIGVTRALWVADDFPDEVFGPRIGAFIYPAGKLEGLALYAGLAEPGPEWGIWVVSRADPGDGSSASGRAVSFRLGIGIARDREHEWLDIDLAVGAAVGFSF